MSALPAPEPDSSRDSGGDSDGPGADDSIDLNRDEPSRDIYVVGDRLILDKTFSKEILTNPAIKAALDAGETDFTFAPREAIMLRFLLRNQQEVFEALDDVWSITLRLVELSKGKGFELVSAKGIFGDNMVLPNPSSLGKASHTTPHTPLKEELEVKEPPAEPPPDVPIEESAGEPTEDELQLAKPEPGVEETRAKESDELSSKEQEYRSAKRFYHIKQDEALEFLLRKERDPIARKMLEEAQVLREEKDGELALLKEVRKYFTLAREGEGSKEASWLCSFYERHRDARENSIFSFKSTRKARDLALAYLAPHVEEFSQSISQAFSERQRDPGFFERKL